MNRKSNWTYIDAFNIVIIVYAWQIPITYILNKYFNGVIITILAELLLLFIPIIYKRYNTGKFYLPPLRIHSKKRFFIETFKGVAIGAIIASISITVQYVLFLKSHNAYKLLANDNAFNTMSIIYLFILTIPISLLVSICDEYFFRKVLYNGLRDKYNLLLSVLICSFIFMIGHNIGLKMTPSLLYYQIVLFIFSAIACLVYEKYNKLNIIIAMHCIYNCLILTSINLFKHAHVI